MPSENFYQQYLTTKQKYRLRQKNQRWMVKYYQKNYLKFLPKNKKIKILEIGFGVGDFLAFLQESGFKNYFGVDISQECFDYCLKRKLGSRRNLIRQDFFKYLEKNSRQFDLIVMNEVLEHINKEKILSSLKLIKSRLKKNGKLIVKLPNCAHPLLGSSSRYCDFTHAVGFTEESLKQVLAVAGFKKIKIFPQDIWVFHPFLNLLGRTWQIGFSQLFRFLFLLYGRQTTTIFTKNLIAVSQ